MSGGCIHTPVHDWPCWNPQALVRAAEEARACLTLERIRYGEDEMDKLRRSALRLLSAILPAPGKP